MLSVVSAISTGITPPEYWLRKVEGLVGIDRNEFTVSNKHHAFDGNDQTFANAAFWGAGQGIVVNLSEPIRIGKARMKAHVYEGPGWGSCVMSFGSSSISTDYLEDGERVWNGDETISKIDVVEYARTRIYAIEIWEKVFFSD